MARQTRSGDDLSRNSIIDAFERPVRERSSAARRFNRVFTRGHVCLHFLRGIGEPSTGSATKIVIGQVRPRHFVLVARRYRLERLIHHEETVLHRIVAGHENHLHVHHGE